MEENNKEVIILLLSDPRVNPKITPEKANLLRTSLTINLDEIIQQYEDDLPQFILSVDHALEKELTKQTARNLKNIQVLEQHNKMYPNIANTMGTFSGSRNRRNTITNSLYRMKGNYFGPKLAHRKKTRKANKLRV